MHDVRMLLLRDAAAPEERVELEADQRHAEYIAKALNMQDAKEVCTAGEDTKPWKEEEESKELSPELASEYRSLAARAN